MKTNKREFSLIPNPKSLIPKHLCLLLALAISLTFSCSSDGDGGGGGGSGCDINSGGYKTVKIGTQTWMAENFNCNVEGSKCYNEDKDNCNKYGRLYDWATAMNLPSSCNDSSCSSQINSKHQGICPSGWHIPSNEDWTKLFRYVDGSTGTSDLYNSPTAGGYLKSTSGWNSNGNGTDSYGFAALPGGLDYSDGRFYYVGDYGRWWSASEYTASDAYDRRMDYDIEYAYYYDSSKSFLFSVRCLQD